MNKKRLVVIGGGGAGHKIAFELQKTFDVTLVDPKTYWEVPMALPRLMVAPEALPAQIAYSDFLKEAVHRQGSAVTMTRKSVDVSTKDGIRTIPFDFAVVASGSRYIDPLVKAEALSQSDRMAELWAAHRKIATAKSIVVAGGGPVGVETAAELRETFPTIAVKLVHGGPKLLDSAPNKFPGCAMKDLQAQSVTVVLEDMVVTPTFGAPPEDGKVRTKSGKIFAADYIVWAAGTKPNTEFMRQSFPNCVEENGLLKTDPILRLKGHPNIFVAGDITNLPEGRLIITASFHTPSIVANLKTLDADASATLKPYKSALPVGEVTPWFQKRRSCGFQILPDIISGFLF